MWKFSYSFHNLAIIFTSLLVITKTIHCNGLKLFKGGNYLRKSDKLFSVGNELSEKTFFLNIVVKCKDKVGLPATCGVSGPLLQLSQQCTKVQNSNLFSSKTLIKIQGYHIKSRLAQFIYDGVFSHCKKKSH